MAKIRLLHTSDWHLGKKLFNKERITEQQLYLNWLYQELQQKQYDYLIVAGDIFDVPNPSNSALKLFYDFIYRIGKLPNLQTIIIGGNHDSSSLLQIPNKIFEDLNCKIFTGLGQDLNHYTFINEIRGIKLGFKVLPYFKNYELINHLSEQSLISEFKDQDQIESFFRTFFTHWKDNCDHKILISHHNFGKAELAGSEQAIFLSGIESFPLKWVDEEFDYIALGHIHKKVEVKKDPPIIYPGSPIPMRFSEGNIKSVIKIEIENNNLFYEPVKIPSFRLLIQLKGNKEEISKKIKKLDKIKEDELSPFVEVLVNLEKPNSGLAETFKKSLAKKGYELVSLIPFFDKPQDEKNISQSDLNELSLDELFKKYYYYKFNTEDVPTELIKSFTEILQDLNNEDT